MIGSSTSISGYSIIVFWFISNPFTDKQRREFVDEKPGGKINLQSLASVI